MYDFLHFTIIVSEFCFFFFCLSNPATLELTLFCIFIMYKSTLQRCQQIYITSAYNYHSKNISSWFQVLKKLIFKTLCVCVHNAFSLEKMTNENSSLQTATFWTILLVQMSSEAGEGVKTTQQDPE